MAVPGNEPDHTQQEQQYGNRHNDRKKQFRPAWLRCALHAAAPVDSGFRRSNPAITKMQRPLG
jgi:hypothetical protein